MYQNRPLRKDEDLFERVQVAKRIAKDVSSLGLDNLPLSLGLFGGW